MVVSVITLNGVTVKYDGYAILYRVYLPFFTDDALPSHSLSSMIVDRWSWWCDAVGGSDSGNVNSVDGVRVERGEIAD